MSRMKIGYFGGTFDPPHLGHMILAVEVKYYLGLDALYWIITPQPPHKKERTITSLSHRLEMLQAAIEGQEGFFISEVDMQRDPPHFAADSVEILKRENPGDELVYIIGEDSLHDLPDWHTPGRFLASIDQLAVASRPNIKTDLDVLDEQIPGIKDKTHFLPEISIEISSTIIRERVRKKQPFAHFVGNKVAEYIIQQGLYQQ
jgi:nicotinate-nucleotide adenylyltransferase